MNIVLRTQAEIDQIISLVEDAFKKRGVLTLETVEQLLDLVRQAQFTMALVEKKTALATFNEAWLPQYNLLKECEDHLARIILRSAIPIDDHEAATR